MSDEAIDAENEHVFQVKPLRIIQINASGWFDRTGGGPPIDAAVLEPAIID
jgi:hypothetical protein